MQDRIRNQEEIIKETKSLLLNQSVALNGQGRVVETALKLTESLSLEKIESIVKREVELEKKEEIRQIETQYKDLIDNSKNESTIQKERIGQLENMLTEVTKEWVVVFLIVIISELFKKDDEHQKTFISDIPSGKGRDLIESIFDGVKKEMQKAKGEIG